LRCSLLFPFRHTLRLDFKMHLCNGKYIIFYDHCCNLNALLKTIKYHIIILICFLRMFNFVRLISNSYTVHLLEIVHDLNMNKNLQTINFRVNIVNKFSNFFQIFFIYKHKNEKHKTYSPQPQFIVIRKLCTPQTIQIDVLCFNHNLISY